MKKNRKLKELEKKMSYVFGKKKLLKKALTHKSAVKSPKKSNEVFEFLGDSIIEFYLSKNLVEKFPNLEEGKLSKLRAILSSRKYIFKISKRIDLGEYIFMSKGERQDEGEKKVNIASSAFEAVVAAIYLDSGQESVDIFLSYFYKDFFKKMKNRKIKINDYKSEVQEYFQKKWKKAPSYEVDKELGPEHDKLFKVTMFGINNEILVEGIGKTIKQAEQNAAKKYLNSVFPKKNKLDFDDFFIEIKK